MDRGDSDSKTPPALTPSAIASEINNVTQTASHAISGFVGEFEKPCLLNSVNRLFTRIFGRIRICIGDDFVRNLSYYLSNGSCLSFSQER